MQEESEAEFEDFAPFSSSLVKFKQDEKKKKLAEEMRKAEGRGESSNSVKETISDEPSYIR